MTSVVGTRIRGSITALLCTVRILPELSLSTVAHLVFHNVRGNSVGMTAVGGHVESAPSGQPVPLITCVRRGRVLRSAQTKNAGPTVAVVLAEPVLAVRFANLGERARRVHQVASVKHVVMMDVAVVAGPVPLVKHVMPSEYAKRHAVRNAMVSSVGPMAVAECVARV
jgi:hypothetical protein